MIKSTFLVLALVLALVLVRPTPLEPMEGTTACTVFAWMTDIKHAGNAFNAMAWKKKTHTHTLQCVRTYTPCLPLAALQVG